MRVAPTKQASAPQAVLFAGLSLMTASATWWLIYYGQLAGMFGRLETKLGCLSGDSADCSNLQLFIGPSAIPAYSPILLWGGVVVVVLGLYLTARDKA